MEHGGGNSVGVIDGGPALGPEPRGGLLQALRDVRAREGNVVGEEALPQPLRSLAHFRQSASRRLIFTPALLSQPCRRLVPPLRHAVLVLAPL